MSAKRISEKEFPITKDATPRPLSSTDRERFRDLLKQIVENLRSPERLDSHPWVHSLTVQDMIAHDPALAGKSPGAQLAFTVGKLFWQLLPSTPPQLDGKQLDRRWGRFGILAANYFGPLLFGEPYPHSLRDALRRVDQAILLFVYRARAEQLKPGQIEPFKLVSDEVNWAGSSTITDWHRGGLQDLADLFVSREKSLSISLGRSSILFAENGSNRSRKSVTPGSSSKGTLSFIWRWGTYALSAAVLLGMTAAGIVGYPIYQGLQAVKQDVADLTKADPLTMRPEDLQQKFGPLLAKTHSDLEAVRSQVSPWTWLTGNLGWMPVYGGDLEYSDALLETASGFTDAAYQSYLTALPIWVALQGKQDLKGADLTKALIDTRPSLLKAQAALEKAKEMRAQMNLARLSPGVRDSVTRLDGYISALDQGLALATSVPDVLGGTDSGPKTYLILVENEDELRATGGFITAVGKAVVSNGELASLSIDDSYNVDDINKAYPAAPWQMQSYMNIPIMTFRDVSWYTDYPTAVRWARYLYAYTDSSRVDGVIAIDQHVLATILSVTGPVAVSALNTTVTSDNIRTVMRAQKVAPPVEQRDPNWYRKQFMNPIASAVLQRLFSGTGISWEQLLTAMMTELDGRHILVQLDDAAMAKLLAERGWDGVVRNGGGDFLMAVDANVGYNKTNAVVSSSISYDVNLTDLSAPAASLLISEQNAAQGTGSCNQWPENVDQTTMEYWYPIDRCYYDYLRVYVPAGTQLTAAAAHAVPSDEMTMLEQDVPARVDLLDEALPNVQGFGTLLVVPKQGSLTTGFQFNLPATVLQMDPNTGEQIYHLKIQKQAGTVDTPITIRIHLPQGSRVDSASPAYAQDGPNLILNLDLKTDTDVRVIFRP